MCFIRFGNWIVCNLRKIENILVKENFFKNIIFDLKIKKIKINRKRII